VLSGTYVGLLLFVAGVCPGYWWVSVVEGRKPRRERTQLLEAAELLSIGALATTVVTLVTLLIANKTGVIDTHRLFADSKTYIRSHPIAVVSALLVTLLIANTGTWCVAHLAYRGKGQIVHETALYRLFMHAPAASRAYVTVERRDGSAVAGWFHMCSAEPCPPDEQELALARVGESKLKVRMPGRSTFVDMDDHCVLLPGSSIRGVYVTYYARTPTTARRRESTVAEPASPASAV
jgi:hypothetical protein